MSNAKRHEGASNCCTCTICCQIILLAKLQICSKGWVYDKCSEVGGQLLESSQENNDEQTHAEEQSSHSPKLIRCLVKMK